MEEQTTPFESLTEEQKKRVLALYNADSGDPSLDRMIRDILDEKYRQQVG